MSRPIVVLFCVLAAGACRARGTKPVVPPPSTVALPMVVTPRLTAQTSGTSHRLQAVSAVDAQVVWASGLGGTVVRTVDGGKTWRSMVVPGAEALEFRDVHAVSEQSAYVLAAGLGAASRIYRTEDGGAHWRLVYQNHNPDAFFNCFAFLEPTRAIVMGDSMGGQMPLLTTDDGDHWRAIATGVPPAQPEEASFAASGTCVAALGANAAWFVTGGAPKARIFATVDGGARWAAHDLPIPAGTKAGGFTVDFRDPMHGLAGGGSERTPDQHTAQIVKSSDGGKTWQRRMTPSFPAPIYALAYARNRDREAEGQVPVVVATGPGGTAWSPDEGEHWTPLDQTRGFWSVGFGDQSRGWLVGTEGRILRIDFPRPAETP